MSKKIAFFEINDKEKKYFQKNLFEQNLSFFSQKIDKNNLPLKNDFEIIVVFIGSKIDEQTIQHFPNLKFIATRSTGVDHINLKVCKKRGIKVANVPVYGDNTVAEHTFALILNLSRKIYQSYDKIKRTHNFELEGLQGFDLKNKVLGVVGTGHIGRHVIRIANGFQMKVLAFDVYPDKDFAQKFNFQYTKNLEELLANSDIISLHVPLNSHTHHLINKDNIYKIKKGAYIINTARGGIIATEALVKALKDGHLAGAGLDVLEGEKTIKEELEIFTSEKYEIYDLVEGYQSREEDLKVLIQNRLLLTMKNVIITPHNAFNSKEALERIWQTTVENIQSFLEKNPKNLVN